MVFELAVPRTQSEGKEGERRQKKTVRGRWGGSGGTRDWKVGEGNGGEQKGGVTDRQVREEKWSCRGAVWVRKAFKITMRYPMILTCLLQHYSTI